MKNVFFATIILLVNAAQVLSQPADTFDVYFERNEARLNVKGTDLINRLISDRTLNRGQKLTILGYADYLGADSLNDLLSVTRAKNVVAYLIKTGFDKKNINTCLGKGKIDRAPAGKDGYSLDRKVQIIAGRKGVTQPKATLNIEMVKVKGDSFNFAIGKYDITEAQWRAVMGKDHHIYSCDSCPVANVSWLDVQSFLQKLNDTTGRHYRLATEAEWDYAANGGSKSHNYYFAGSNDINIVGWYVNNSNNRTHPVGQKQPNELGIYDMSGNVWQWCRRTDTSKCERVLKGGAYFLKPPLCRRTYKNLMSCRPDERTDAIGFRVAYSL